MVTQSDLINESSPRALPPSTRRPTPSFTASSPPNPVRTSATFSAASAVAAEAVAAAVGAAVWPAEGYWAGGGPEQGI